MNTIKRFREWLKTPTMYEVRCRGCGHANGQLVSHISMSGYVCDVCQAMYETAMAQAMKDYDK